MHRARIALLVVLATAPLAAAQLAPSASAVRPEFDAASIKEQRDPGISPHWRASPAGLSAVNQSVQMLIGYVYGFRQDRIIGFPDWLESSRYDIQARTNRPDVAMATVKSMIETLLADRFRLRMHVEERPADVYALVVARRDRRLGPALTWTTGCEAGRTCGSRTRFDRGLVSIDAGGRPLDDLVKMLDGTVGRRVVDRTGLSGSYDYELRFKAMPSPGAPAEPGDIPEVFTALREQLGLALRSERGSVEMLVIDRIEPPLPD